jgi:hypothetical protein
MAYLEMDRTIDDAEPGDRVYHEDYGEGTVLEHPDAPGDDYPNDPRNDLHVWFDETPETTLRRVLKTKVTLL